MHLLSLILTRNWHCEISSEGPLSPVRTTVPSTSVDPETPSIPQSEKRFFGLTLAEIEAEIPELEKEIRTNLIKASALYTELRDTDGTAEQSPEIATWRDETWKEVKRLFHDVADTGKIMRYRSYLRVTGVEKDPVLPGGWIYALMEPLPDAGYPPAEHSMNPLSKIVSENSQ